MWQGYVLAQGPNLLAGFIGASLAAIATVTAVEAIQRTRLVDGGAAIGIVFPAMFALGTVLVTRQFSDIHLDADAILFGNIEFVAFDTLTIDGRDLGPQSIWVMSLLCAINLLFIGIFYKELKLTTFDPGLAAALGFSPVIVHYALMLVLSITSVGAFTAVGAVLVVALVIVPAATAYLLTDRLALMIPSRSRSARSRPGRLSSGDLPRRLDLRSDGDRDGRALRSRAPLPPRRTGRPRLARASSPGHHRQRDAGRPPAEPRGSRGP